MKIKGLVLIAIVSLVGALTMLIGMKNEPLSDFFSRVSLGVTRIEDFDVESRTEFQRNLLSFWDPGGFILVNGLANFYESCGEDETKELVAALRYFGVDDRVAADLERGWVIRPKLIDFEYFENPSPEFDDIETRIFEDFEHPENMVYKKYLEHKDEL